MQRFLYFYLFKWYLDSDSFYVFWQEHTIFFFCTLYWLLLGFALCLNFIWLNTFVFTVDICPYLCWLIQSWKYSSWSFFVLDVVYCSPSVHVCFFSKANFCANIHAQLCHLCHTILSVIMAIYHSHASLFAILHLSSTALHWYWRFSQLQHIIL